MENLILIKLGGSLITDKSKPYIAKPAVISRLAKEIRQAQSPKYGIIVAHGSGSFGHTLASKYKTANGVKTKKDVYGLCLVQQDAIAINRIVNKIFLKNKLNCLSFVPSSFSFARNKKLKTIFIEPIVTALSLGIIPIVFGDIILDEENGCCIFSGETTLDNLASELNKHSFTVKRVIQCGITNGVYDVHGRTINQITFKNFPRIEKQLSGSDSVDVTGGMLHKVRESLRLTRLGINSLIVSGRTPGNLKKAILGKKVKGTLVK